VKLARPINIDLLDFFKTRTFDCLKFGQDKSWVSSHFPAPDSQFDKEMQSGGFDIWTYGNIELHFENEKLFLIFSDDLGDLSGGEHLTLQRWILEDVEQLNCLFVMKSLNAKNINFNKQTDNLDVTLKFKSGVELTFEKINDQDNLSSNDFRLISFGLVAETPHRCKG